MPMMPRTFRGESAKPFPTLRHYPLRSRETGSEAAMHPLTASWDIGRILVNLVPLVIGAAVGGPMWIIMTLLLLRSDRGVTKAAAFAAGAITVRLLQFVLFSRIFGTVLNSGGEAELGLMSSILLLLAGIV